MEEDERRSFEKMTLNWTDFAKEMRNTEYARLIRRYN